MRNFAVVGAGEAGLQLAVGLLEAGHNVTIVSERSSEEILRGNVLSSQCVFDSAVQNERKLGLNFWDELSPAINEVAARFTDSDHNASFTAPLNAPAHSVDQRLKCAEWLEHFQKTSGELIIRHADTRFTEDLARDHDLVIVATGKGNLGRLFSRDATKSSFDRPQRALALTYVRGPKATQEKRVMSFSSYRGVGELIVVPALTMSGPCEIMVFEGIPGGPMDCWDQITSPKEHLRHSLELVEQLFPAERARFDGAELVDDGGVLRTRLTPTVRHPVATLDSGTPVLGIGDAVLLNDPVSAQGSNNAAHAARVYLDSIMRHGDDPFDRAWMESTFLSFWRGWGQWSVSWTNAMLRPRQPHHLGLLSAAQTAPELARAIVNAFDDPRTVHNWWFDPVDAERFIDEMRQAELNRFSPRQYRQALGQYATGVAVITTRGADGAKVGITANSFTSVSMDPPLVSWCVAKSAPSFAGFAEASHFAVNVLGAGQLHLSRQFSTPAPDKFADVTLTEGLGGVPLIADAVARFQCRTVRNIDAGDHAIFMGEVERYDANGGEPLVFHSGSFHVPTRHPDDA
ncbi:flavin reductase [Mycolicibacterium sp. XJ2546]